VIGELNIEVPKKRSNFHLYNKVEQLANETGWKTIVKWDQRTVFPFIFPNQLKSYA
jgi:hypothetical protein